jgi:hypothetical protein
VANPANNSEYRGPAIGSLRSSAIETCPIKPFDHQSFHRWISPDARLKSEIRFQLQKLEGKGWKSPCQRSFREDYDTTAGEIHDNVKNATT